MKKEKSEEFKSNNYIKGKISFFLGIVTLLMIFVANGYTAIIGLTTGIVGIIFRYYFNQEIKV